MLKRAESSQPMVFARHFQGFSEVEIDTFDSLTKKDKDDKEGGALSELEKYVRCKFV